MVKNQAIKCKVAGCKKSYSSRCNLNRHIKLHHKKIAFVCPLCQKELSSKLTDRRMVAIESLGHIGKDARGLLPRLRQIQDKNPIIQKLVNDAVKRIQ